MRHFVLFSLLVLSFACQRKTYTLEKLPENYLVYGQGGGFTGQETSAYLFPNGQRLQFKSLSRDTLELPSLKRRHVRDLFALADSVFQGNLVDRQPGNRYQFVRYQTADTLYQATWGAMGYTPPAALTRLYRQLSTVEEK